MAVGGRAHQSRARILGPGEGDCFYRWVRGEGLAHTRARPEDDRENPGRQTAVAHGFGDRLTGELAGARMGVMGFDYHRAAGG